jgi:hypothetical protein
VRVRAFALLIVFLAFAPAAARAASQKPCIPLDEAQQYLNKDICIAAHVYDVVELPDGTRFLDVCSPLTPDDACRFTIESLREDHTTVGELRTLRGTDVHIRGLVQPMHGRAGMLLSHARQFHGGPPKFRPNSLLVRGFSAEQERPPLNDPNLRSQGGHRAFMNTRDLVASPSN